MGSIPIARSIRVRFPGAEQSTWRLYLSMLNRLKVSNLAIVESAEAEFAPGLNVLTGETGAGKSVLMGALELVTGARADSGVVREGAIHR